MFRSLKCYYKNKKGKEQIINTSVNQNVEFSELEKYFLNKYFNFGVEGDDMYTCYKIEDVTKYDRISRQDAKILYKNYNVYISVDEKEYFLIKNLTDFIHKILCKK